MRRMNFDFWMKTFKPIKNTITPHSWAEGMAFETYGDDLKHVYEVAKTAPRTVWTLVDIGNGMTIQQGLHFVNRIGYFITEVPCSSAELAVKYN